MSYEIRGPYLRPEPKPCDIPPRRRPDLRWSVLVLLSVSGFITIASAHPTDGFAANMTGIGLLSGAIGIGAWICERPRR